MHNTIDKWDEVLRHVQKPGRYIGGEWNEIKKDLRSVKTKVALAFPDLYEVGMSYLGQKILYHILNANDSILAERVFAPWIDCEKELRKRTMTLCSLENKIPICAFDIIGFSLLYELNYSNILTILDTGKIPFLSSDRCLKYPLVIAGGPAVFNPEPLADLFDAFLIGDGEEAFLEIIKIFEEFKGKIKKKRQLLYELSGIKGVYVPSLYKPYRPAGSFLQAVKPEGNAPSLIKKRCFFPLTKDSFPEKIVVPNIKVIFERVAVEAVRGCPQNCRFCQARTLYFPARVKEPGNVYKKVLESLRNTGYEDASLSALSIGDYPYLEEVMKCLMEKLEENKISLSLSSLRPEKLTSEVVENILKVRKTGFTIVPEAGTERLRRVINKHLKDSDIWKAAENAFSHGWEKIKLYFMVGLPTEKEEDLDGIVNTVKEIIRIGYRIMKRPPKINLSVASFIPKSHTSFQWLGMENEKDLLTKHRFIKSELKKYSFVKFKEHPLKNAILEAVFSRGDRRLTQVLIKAWKEGARFDGWNEQFDILAWERAFESEGLDFSCYLSKIELDIDLPWDHIDAGINKSHLAKELKNAMDEKNTPVCQKIQCIECGGCSIGLLKEKSFDRKIQTYEPSILYYGKKSEREIRYRLKYSKEEKARYLSHGDVNNVIKRSFRRALVPVKFTKGFHPKMVLVFAPALPLGMAGKNEILEFRSAYEFSEDEFVLHVNAFFPSGFKVIDLEKIELNRPSLNDEIEYLEYSLEISQDIIKTIMQINIQKKENYDRTDYFEIMERQIKNYNAIHRNELIKEIKVDKAENKVIFILKFTYNKSIKPQDMAKEIFGIENPVYYMARERIILKPGNRKSSKM